MLIDNAPPLLIFTFKKLAVPFTNFDLGVWANEYLSEAPEWTQVGMPIPFPLSRSLGWVDDGDANTFTVRTDIVNEKVIQRGLNQEVQAKFRIEKRNLIYRILVPLLEKCFQYMNSEKYEYNVTYINGATLIFNGRISDFETSPNADNNSLMNVNFSITTEPLQTGNEKKTKVEKEIKDTGSKVLMNAGSSVAY